MGALSLVALANFLWLLGYPDQARKRSREALTLVQEVTHPWSTAVVWMFNLGLPLFLHEIQNVQQRAEALTVLANEQGFSLPLAEATMLRGWALVMQGYDQEGIGQICEGITILKTIGIELRRPYSLALLTEAYEKTGQVEEGLMALAEALETVDKTGERFYEAELYRLYGELSLRVGETANRRTGEKFEVAPSPDLPVAPLSPEACFLKAIEVTQKQQAKSLELRASMSLARLWRQQGKRVEGHRILSKVYEWFTEGFDTKDLQEAKALLEELA